MRRWTSLAAATALLVAAASDLSAEVFEPEPLRKQAPPHSGAHAPVESPPQAAAPPPALGPPQIIGEALIGPGRARVTLDESLGVAASVFSQNRYNHAQEVRLSVRGFGARTPFGIRGVRLLLDGFPLTLPDGQSQPAGVDLDALRRIVILRGPLSSRYGNAAGGVLALETAEPGDQLQVEARFTAGQHGLVRSRLAAGGGQGPARLLFGASHLRLLGHRERSQTQRTIIRSRLEVDTGSRSHLTLILSALDVPLAEDPGGLTAQQLVENPRQASELSRRFRTGEAISQGRAGLRYTHALGRGHQLEGSSYALVRRLDNNVPFRVVDLLRVFSGGGLLHRWERQLGQRLLRSEAGLELSYLRDDRQNYESLEGERGGLILDEDETVLAVGAFLQLELELIGGLHTSAGVRVDQLTFGVEDQLLDGSRSGSREFRQLSGSAGARYQALSWLAVRGRVAQGFETPTLTELTTRPAEAVGLDPALRPERSLLLETGVDLTFSERLQLRATGFWISLADELVRYEDETSRAYFRNAGQSRRLGAEAELSCTLGPLELLGSYTFTEAVFVRHQREDVDLAGRFTPGVPRQQVAGELLWRGEAGKRLAYLAALGLRRVGEVYADDLNQAAADSFVLLEARAEAALRLGPLEIRPFAGATNLLNRPYVANVRVNAAGGRYFEPAPGLSVHGGAGAVYLF